MIITDSSSSAYAITSRKAKTSVKNAQAGRPRPVTRASRALGAPMSAITCEKIDAKMMMSITIDVVRTVSWKASRRAVHVRRRARAASTMLTLAPSAAASVGVTMPRYIEPSTTTTSNATGATS